MGNDELERREVLEQVRIEKLHERRGVPIDVMGPGVMEVGVAGRAGVNHRRYVKLDQRFVQRVPPPVGEWGIGPVAAGRVRVQVAADETELRYAAPQLVDTVLRPHPG